MLKRELVRGIVISNTCVKLYRNWIINEVARAGEHTNERTYVRTYVLTYIRTGQTLYPLHNFVVRGDNKRPQSKSPPTCEMSVCGEYVYNMYVKKCHQRDDEFPPPNQSPSPDQTRHGPF